MCVQGHESRAHGAQAQACGAAFKLDRHTMVMRHTAGHMLHSGQARPAHFLDTPPRRPAFGTLPLPPQFAVGTALAVCVCARACARYLSLRHSLHNSQCYLSLRHYPHVQSTPPSPTTHTHTRGTTGHAVLPTRRSPLDSVAHGREVHHSNTHTHTHTHTHARH